MLLTLGSLVSVPKGGPDEEEDAQRQTIDDSLSLMETGWEMARSPRTWLLHTLPDRQPTWSGPPLGTSRSEQLYAPRHLRLPGLPPGPGAAVDAHTDHALEALRVAGFHPVDLATREEAAPTAAFACRILTLFNVVAVLPMLPVRDAAYALSALAATTSAAGRAGRRFLWLLLAMTFPILDEGQ